VAKIVSAMRSFAHPPTSCKAPMDIAEAIRTTLVVAGSEYKYVADVELELATLPALRCNAGDIHQVLLNLVVNASQAIAEAAGESGQRGRIRIRTWQEGDQLALSVSDTGGGIPDAIADRVFDPFFTTKEVGRGTGQGLAITRTIIVERHDGTITFVSEPGLGTTFEVRLPFGIDEDDQQPMLGPAMLAGS
jgi:signal transduction histidine kinase